MTAQSPATIAELCHDLRRYADRIEKAYGWLHDSGFEQRRGGAPSGGSGGVADLSGLMVGTDQARRLLAAASLHVAKAVASTKGADKALVDLAALIDAGRDRTLQPTVARELRQYGQAVSAANRADGEAAQARREERGATMPGSDYGRPT